ncbi:inositol monophosphatase family protein [Streptomyces sp. NPDC006430]|uniref:inositol monophosphatase family protein n=1 Tax=Streptomyces sp. NPDC006430 TaxID=3154299 RepID=UPI0033BBF9BE
MTSEPTAVPDRLRVARLAAEQASRTALDFFQRPRVRNWAKEDGSLVTEADLATEERVREVLAELAPGERVMGEEFGGSGGNDGHWIVDPVDGTENFRRGVPVWGVLIAWSAGGQVTDAVIAAPALGRSWSASRGRGAHDGDGRRLRVSTVADRAEASFSFGGAHEYEPAAMARLGAFASGFRTAWGIGNFYGHVLVAEGAADGALSVGTSVWDVAAPSLIVEEAGGSWSDLDAGLRLDSGAVLTSNGVLHEPILRGVRAACATVDEDREQDEERDEERERT